MQILTLFYYYLVTMNSAIHPIAEQIAKPTSELIQIRGNLDQAIFSTPFSFLGMHPNTSGKGLVIRAWNPYAASIKVYSQPQGKLLGKMEAFSEESGTADGLFQLHLPRRKKLFSYQLTVTNKDGSTHRYFDPYQFGQYVLSQTDIDPLRLYDHLGAVSVKHALSKAKTINGILFKVYAPNARSVSVVGDFNQWDGRCHPMASADDGIWRLFIPEVTEGMLYKFEIHDQHNNCLPLKADPFGRKAEQWPGLASIVQKASRFKWSDKSWLAQRETNHQKPLSIYELHAGSWKKNDNGDVKSYRQLADDLIPYVRKMGFTHIELMPVSEHPLYESWGYQPLGLFAPTSRYGTPDDFRYFVDQCHQAGIGVILDWVPAHFPEDDHGLARFDGTALFEYEDPKRGWHPDWKSCIYNYGSPWVQDFLISNALFWLEEFHVDGLRVDAVASMLYLDYSREHGEWEPNMHGGNEHLEAVQFLQRLNHEVHGRFPGCMTIAEESTSWPGVSRTGDHFALGFDYKWNMGWMHDTLSYIKHDSVHRKYHHNELTFSMVYAYNEDFILPISHDEVVHGKGTLLTRMPGDDWQRFANLRAYLGFMFAHPGKKLLFMGSEFGVHEEWNPAHSLDWSLLNGEGFHTGAQRLVADLNKAYQAYPALYEQDHNSNGFQWLILDDHDQSVIAFLRKDSAGKCVVVISNMTPAVRHHYSVGVPVAGQWQEIINSDRGIYGGSDIVNESVHTQLVAMHGQAQSLSLTLPPLATIMLTIKQ